jgi:hypothetical protein
MIRVYKIFRKEGLMYTLGFVIFILEFNMLKLRLPAELKITHTFQTQGGFNIECQESINYGQLTGVLGIVSLYYQTLGLLP